MPGGPFFTDAEWEVGGWEWHAQVDSRILPNDTGEWCDVLKMVRLELWLRIADHLGCAMQHVGMRECTSS